MGLNAGPYPMLPFITERRKDTLCWLAGLGLILLGILILIKPIFEQNGLEYIYDLPEEALVEHLDEVDVSIADSSETGHTFSARFYALTGCVKANGSKIYLAESQEFEMKKTSFAGEVKVAIVSEADRPTLVACEGCFTLDADSYDLYYVGSHFVGSVQVSATDCRDLQ